MNLDPKFKVSEFPSQISIEFLKKIYNLNQEHTPEVGSLSSVKYLNELIGLSSKNFYISFENTIIGFMICFREGSKYKSKNYNFFTQNESKFLYIDRIAIKSDYRRKGVGRSLYALIDAIAKNEEIPLCCEINIQPLNQISIDFHESLGFCRIDEFAFDDHEVAYFIKKHS